MSFNRYFENHWGSCALLATTYDHCRKRAVKVHAIPGRFDLVGVSDGTDCWVAPVVADPFSVNIKRLLEDYAAGKPLLRPRVRAAKFLTPAVQPELPLDLPPVVRSRVRVRT